MFNLFIVLGEIIFAVILIWAFINRKIIKKVIKYTWAHYAMMYGKFEEDDIDEINYDDLIEEKEDAKYNYPIKRSMAIEISKKNNTLKTDFCRNSDREGISYLSFNEYKTDLVALNHKKYWQFQVYSGDISWISNEKNETIYNDGWLSDNDLKFLKCLVDTETGDYIYYPKVKKYKERTVKYEDAINGVIKIDDDPPEWMKRLDDNWSKEENSELPSFFRRVENINLETNSGTQESEVDDNAN